MIFMCFSSGDRYSIVKSILYHLYNYELKVWYDYHQLILGDNKNEKNFKNAIETSNYFIIIYSKNFFNSPCALEEEKRIYDEAKKRKISIFPILYDLSFNELPKETQHKTENIIYNIISKKSNTLPMVNQIITKILIDFLHVTELEYTPKINKSLFENLNDEYLNYIINEYLSISNLNFNARISILFCIYNYIQIKYLKDDISKYYHININYLFNATKLNIEINHKEIIIAELGIILLSKQL